MTVFSEMAILLWKVQAGGILYSVGFGNRLNLACVCCKNNSTTINRSINQFYAVPTLWSSPQAGAWMEWCYARDGCSWAIKNRENHQERLGNSSGAYKRCMFVQRGHLGVHSLMLLTGNCSGDICSESNHFSLVDHTCLFGEACDFGFSHMLVVQHPLDWIKSSWSFLSSST